MLPMGFFKIIDPWSHSLGERSSSLYFYKVEQAILMYNPAWEPGVGTEFKSVFLECGPRITCLREKKSSLMTFKNANVGAPPSDLMKDFYSLERKRITWMLETTYFVFIEVCVTYFVRYLLKSSVLRRMGSVVSGSVGIQLVRMPLISAETKKGQIGHRFLLLLEERVKCVLPKIMGTH